ncbi:hypothetical protein CANINC_002545 [Pichia inconspicua]|uniref:RIC1 C-terminal alpha solenoid region domain-containing protein n=1 Tax=Pichia inconspicua TaxID=52247 RepID=A0A4T0X100_9ASCO|nr:hypothetical protein CANINC_002545 [[Candida] inconspicua]
MYWPTSISQVQNLPQLKPFEEIPECNNHKYDPNPHNDEIITILSNYTNGLPFVILTYRSIYVYDWTHKTPVNIHVRSNDSIDKFGKNESVKLSPNQQTFAVMTDKNHILVYTIQLTNDNEVLVIQSNNGDIYQNGYPITNYQQDDIVYGGVDSKYTEGRNVANQGIVKNFIGSFLNNNDNEVLLKDYSLRLKLVLNVASPIVEYCFINSMELMLINTAPHAFQIIQLNSKKIDTSTDNINFILADKLDWFIDSEINNSSEIVYMDYNYDLDCFLWINEQGDVLLVKHSGTVADIRITAKLVYRASMRDGNKACQVLINHFKNLCYVILETSEILIYKLQHSFSCQLLKIIGKCLPAKKVNNIYLHPHGGSFVVLYQNGWNSYSALGNLNFSTFEYDVQKITNSKSIQFLGANQMILVNNLNEIVSIDLTVCNTGDGFNSLSMKRPLLYDSDKISIFKAYEKEFIEHNHQFNEIANEENNVWLNEMIPVGFRIHNNLIRSCSVSDDGNNVCIVGNHDVVIFSNVTKKWKYLEIIQEEVSFDKVESAIQKCLWWKNFLILGTNDRKRKESKLFVFSERILEPNEGFTVDSIVWSYDFSDTPFDEHFVNFNIDLFNDTFFVFTSQFNCYTWNLKMEVSIQDKIVGDYAALFAENSSLKTIKKQIILQRSVVHQLKSCFNEHDDSVILNFGTILKVSETDLALLSNTDLFYIRKERHGNLATLINSSVEYIYKLSPSLLCLFDGSKLIHYNLSTSTNLLELKPITINTGNDLVINDGIATVNYSGVCLYPITTISNQNTMFGVEVECFNKVKLQLETNRKNYLSDLVDHYILSNIRVKNLEEDSNAINIATVYGKFSVFKNFNFVLEKLMVDYLQKCYDDSNYDKDDEYFMRLYDLIILTGKFYEIVLNCLKKTETQFWPIFFTKSKENPRDVVQKLFKEAENQKLTAHYFIIMLNYEKITSSQISNRGNKTNKKEISNKIGKKDQQLIINVLKKLILSHDFETSFELVRFLKIVDDDMTHKCLGKLKAYLNGSQ